MDLKEKAYLSKDLKKLKASQINYFDLKLQHVCSSKNKLNILRIHILLF